MSWTGPEYAVMNLRTIKENIAAYASYAHMDLYEQVEAAQNGIENLIKAIENGLGEI